MAGLRAAGFPYGSRNNTALTIEGDRDLLPFECFWEVGTDAEERWPLIFEPRALDCYAGWYLDAAGM